MRFHNRVAVVEWIEYVEYITGRVYCLPERSNHNSYCDYMQDANKIDIVGRHYESLAQPA